jgi:hypothetical protein
VSLRRWLCHPYALATTHLQANTTLKPSSLHLSAVMHSNPNFLLRSHTPIIIYLPLELGFPLEREMNLRVLQFSCCPRKYFFLLFHRYLNFLATEVGR